MLVGDALLRGRCTGRRGAPASPPARSITLAWGGWRGRGGSVDRSGWRTTAAATRAGGGGRGRRREESPIIADWPGRCGGAGRAPAARHRCPAAAGPDRTPGCCQALPAAPLRVAARLGAALKFFIYPNLLADDYTSSTATGSLRGSSAREQRQWRLRARAAAAACIRPIRPIFQPMSQR